MSCVRGGVLIRMKGLLNLFVTVLFYCSSLKSLKALGLGSGGVLKALLITVTPFPSSLISFFSLLSPEQLVPRLPLSPPTHNSQICQSPALSSIWSPVLHFHPLISCSHQYPQLSLPRVHPLPVLLSSLPGGSAETSRLNEPRSLSVVSLCCHL